MALTATQWLRYLNLNVAVEGINEVECLVKYLSNNIFVSSNISAACTTRLPCHDKQCIRLSFPFYAAPQFERMKNSTLAIFRVLARFNYCVYPPLVLIYANESTICIIIVRMCICRTNDSTTVYLIEFFVRLQTGDRIWHSIINKQQTTL